jgi:regulatory protein
MTECMNEFEEAKRYAYKRLAMRSYHSIELRKVLTEKQFNKESIEQVISELTRLGYLNDKDWIEAYINSLITRNFGPRQIYLKLKAKGIPEDESESFLEKIACTNSQSAHIQTLLKTRYRHRDLSNFKERQKVIASLVRKGFELSEIYSYLNTALSHK